MTKQAKYDALPIEKLRQLLDYNPETGLFYWRHNPANPQKWNTKHAGKIAGSMSNGYIYIRIGSLYPAHRLAWAFRHGEWPKNEIDHINGQRSDNRLCNLREATHSQNLANRGMQRNNTSGFVGVRFRPHHGKWEGRIIVNGKAVWHAYFNSAQEAAAARREVLHLHHGEFAKL